MGVIRNSTSCILTGGVKLFALLFFFSFSAQGQNYKRAFEYSYKKEFDKAKPYFRDALMDNEYDALANYGLALLYYDSANSGKNYYLAFRFIKTSRENADKMPEKELGKAEKIVPGFVGKVKEYDEIIDARLYSYVLGVNTISECVKFEQECPNSTYYSFVKDLRSSLEYKVAVKLNSVSAFNEFIERFPASKECNDAIESRNTLAFEEVKRLNIFYKYNEFLDTYPNDTSLVNKILPLRNKCAFNKYKDYTALEDLGKLKYFIDHFPNCDPRDMEVILKLKGKLEFERAKSRYTVDAMQDFISRHPGFPQIPVAIALRDSLAFVDVAQMAADSGGIFSQFLSTYPFAKQSFDSYLKQYRRDLVPSKMFVERNSLAFELARCKNSKQGYLDFLKISTDVEMNKIVEEKLKELE